MIDMCTRVIYNMCILVNMCIGGGLLARENFTTTLDSELLERLRIQAIKEKRNINDILEQLINEYLKEK